MCDVYYREQALTTATRRNEESYEKVHATAIAAFYHKYYFSGTTSEYFHLLWGVGYDARPH